MKTNQRKRKSLRSSSTEPRAKRLVLRLADLNEYVLSEIFSYLNVQGLVNIVNMDKSFLNSSRRAFKQKYKNRYIPMPFFTRDELPITRQCFARNAELLRYFGGSISSLEVYVNNYPIDQRMLHLIVTCCRETLTELKILYPTVGLKFSKSFPKVRKLTFSQGKLNLSSKQLVKWFPALENLVFDCIEDVGWLLKSGQKITSLKFLSLTTVSDVFFFGHFYHIEDLHNFIALNRQLNEIDLTLNLNIDTLDGQPLPRLHHEIIPDELMTVKLTIESLNDFEYSQHLAHLRIPNDRIGHLEIHVDGVTGQICDYIARCVNMKTLKVETNEYFDLWNDSFSESGWMTLKKFDCLSRLEVTMPVCREDVDAACCSQLVRDVIGLVIGPFFKQVKSVTTIVVRFQGSFQTVSQDFVFDPIRSSIDVKIWSFTVNISSTEISFILTKIQA